MKDCLLFMCILVLIYTPGVSSQSVTITEATVYIKNNVVGQVTCTLTGSCDAIGWYLSSNTLPVASTFIGGNCRNTTSGYYQTCDFQKNQYTFYFTGTTALHGQTIRCSGQFCNPQENVSDTVIISIIVPVPSVGLVDVGGQPQITVTAGQTTSITCSTGAGRPAPNIVWYIGDTNVTSWSTSTTNSIPSQQLFYTTSILIFIPTKSQNGQPLNCKAYNTDDNMVELTSKPTLYVQYIDPIILTPTTNRYIVNETYQLGPVKCTATCNPPCGYKWTRPNQNDLQGDTLTINAIQRTQTGVYKCQATNTVGTRNSNDIAVTVHYAAKMTNIVISGGNNSTVNEHSTQTITCLAEGLPQPRISLRYISNNSIIKSADGLRLDFIFPSARCEDTGIYKCDAINKFTPQLPLQKDVFVLCKPRAAQEPLQNQYALSAGRTLNITVLYLAYPRPSFQWCIYGSVGILTEITNGQQDIHINNTAVNTYKFVTEFIRHNLKEDGFGTYILKSRNIIGAKNDTFIVGAKGIPDRPIGGLATCIGYNSAVITWISGFNNGNEQTFTVIYQEVGGTEQTSVSDIKDPGLQKPTSHTIASLQESKTYVFRIFSRNSFGESSRVEVNCSTSANPNREVSFNTGVAVGAALGSVIVLVITVVVGIFIFKRYQRTSLKAEKYTKDKEDIQMDDSNQTEQKEYEKLGTSDESNVYNVIVSEAAYENPIVPEDKQFDYETLQTPNDQQTYEQITMEDKPTHSAVDTNVYVNTAIS